MINLIFILGTIVRNFGHGIYINVNAVTYVNAGSTFYIHTTDI